MLSVDFYGRVVVSLTHSPCPFSILLNEKLKATKKSGTFMMFIFSLCIIFISKQIISNGFGYGMLYNSVKLNYPINWEKYLPKETLIQKVNTMFNVYSQFKKYTINKLSKVSLNLFWHYLLKKIQDILASNEYWDVLLFLQLNCSWQIGDMYNYRFYTYQININFVFHSVSILV